VCGWCRHGYGAAVLPDITGTCIICKRKVEAGDSIRSLPDADAARAIQEWFAAARGYRVEKPEAPESQPEKKRADDPPCCWVISSLDDEKWELVESIEVRLFRESPNWVRATWSEIPEGGVGASSEEALIRLKVAIVAYCSKWHGVDAQLFTSSGIERIATLRKLVRRKAVGGESGSA